MCSTVKAIFIHSNKSFLFKPSDNLVEFKRTSDIFMAVDGGQVGQISTRPTFCINSTVSMVQLDNIATVNS